MLIDGIGADLDETAISKLDCIAHDVEQHLGQAPLIAITDRKVGRNYSPDLDSITAWSE
jgi:hypothetical protein